MPGRDHETLLRTSYFRVLIGERELGFAEVSELSSKTDDGVPGQEHHQHFETVILRRALTRSTELYDWRRRIVDGADDRRDITIHQLESPDGAIANSWRLVDAWPCRWSGPAFNALSGEVAIEELELAFADLIWLEQTTTQGG
ncbi:MAG TPA: phage tail protein [Gaiellaceae bacterium]|jgi:phage tail-like protein|nr:phage tail protein [Gaiellaceae bacterium]